MKSIKKKPETHPLTWRISEDETTVWIKEYQNSYGYQALKNTLSNFKPCDVVDLVFKSGLKGRGGAGFLTGAKWRLMSQNMNEKKRYLICNADEMEPGTYKDRFLIEKNPHQLLEGMILSAFALQTTCGYIFLRGDYYSSEKILLRAIQEAFFFGYLGENILESTFSFNLHVHTGAGRYICGEETALINSLEGRRANPRFKPPFPSFFGLWGKPTCVNNVETLFNIPPIILHGSEWFSSLSHSEESGTKMMGFSGKVKKPGLWEVPLGISGRELLDKYAGGMQDRYFLRAWQPGGSGTSLLTELDLDVAMDFISLQKIGSRLGTGIALAIDQKVNIVSFLLNIERFFSRESCGFCTPCREGLSWSVKILENFEKKRGCLQDLDVLEELCDTLGPGKTFCAHAPGAAAPLSSAIKIFREDFLKCIQNREHIKNTIKIIFKD